MLYSSSNGPLSTQIGFELKEIRYQERVKKYEEIFKKYNLKQDVSEEITQFFYLIRERFLEGEITEEELDSDFNYIDKLVKKEDIDGIFDYINKCNKVGTGAVKEFNRLVSVTVGGIINDSMTLEEANEVGGKFLVDGEYDISNTKEVKAFFRKNFSVGEYKEYEEQRTWYINELESYGTKICKNEVQKARNNPSYKIKYINKQEKECEVSLEDVERTKNYLEEIAIFCKISYLENRLDILKNHSEIFLKHGQEGCILIFFDDDINKLNIENNELLKWGEELGWGKFLSLYLGIRSLIANLEVDERSKKMQDFISFIREKGINKANEFIEKEQKKVVDGVVSKIKKQKRRGNNFGKINTSAGYNPGEIIEGIPRMFELIQTLGIWKKIKEYLKPSDSFAKKSRFSDDDGLRQRKEVPIVKER